MYDMIYCMENLIKEAVKNLCFNANIIYGKNLYNTLFSRFTETKDRSLKNKLRYILKNVKLAYDSKRPMCQDTGNVIVFIKIGTKLQVSGLNFNKIINEGVKEAYCENFFRKSIVKNALTDRNNTETNTPAPVYIEFDDTDEIKIDLLVKGAGAENMSMLKMFPPSAEKNDILNFIKETVDKAGEKACPPLVLGIGIGGTADGAMVLSKKAFFKQNEPGFSQEIIKFLNSDKILDVKVKSDSAHMASLPVGISVNCHCTRHAGCVIKNNTIFFDSETPAFQPIHPASSETAREILTSDYAAVKSLKPGDEILLTGEIYTARDAAHKRLAAMIKNHEKLPFELNGKIIFYAGPCPEKDGEISGPTGPTTAYRMDKYCESFYSSGLLGTIGKGERTEEAAAAIKKYNGRYFSAYGGISCLLAQCIKTSEIIAFEDLGAEAVRRQYVEKLPVRVEI